MSLERDLQLVIDGAASLKELFFEILFEVLFELRWVLLPVIGQSLRNLLLFVGNTEPLSLVKRKWLDFLNSDLQ